MTTVAADVAVTASDGGVLGSQPRVFFLAWLSGAAVFAAIAAASRSATRRSAAGTVAGVGMLVAGSAALMTIGLPLALAGVIQLFSLMTPVEAAAKDSRFLWPALALIAIGTVVVFALGLASTTV